MRIVIDMQGAQTESRYRGIGRYTMAFAQAVVRNRGEHEILLALSGLFPDTIEPIRAAFDGLLPQENIRVWYAPGPVKDKNPGNAARREVAELIREAFLRSLCPDAVHICSLFEGFVDDAVTSIGRFDERTQVSVTLHDLIPLLNPDQYLTPNANYASYYYRKVDSLKKAALFIAISESSRLEILNALEVSPTAVVNASEGADELFRPVNLHAENAANFLLKLGLSRPFVLYSGGCDERKNLPRLIEAWSRLPNEIRQAHQLLFAGKMPEGNVAEFKRIAKSHGLKDDELLFSGYVSDDELVQLYNLCKLFVFPSWHEGFGLPGLEAMACGAPVIGANTTSLPEVIGLEEALFDPLEVTAITAKLVQGLQDEAFRNRLSEHGLKQAKKFSWDETASKAISAWEDLPLKTVREKSSWRQVSQQLTTIYRRLINDIASEKVGSSDSIDTDLRRTAACLARNERELDSYLRPIALPEKVTWRIEGPFDSSYSLALVNREIARSLAALGYKVVLHSTEGPGDFPPNENFLFENPDLAEMHRLSADVTPIDADIVSRNLYPPRVADMTARFNFLHAYGWEESGFPLDWIENFNLSLQGMTVMSEHVSKVMIDHGVTVPITVSSLGVDHWLKIKPDNSYRLKAKSFRFLHVSSCFPRKGADVMLRAYGKAFRASDDVTLVIKTFSNPHNEIHRWLEDARANDSDFPDVLVLEADYTDSQLKALYGHCHALVAPSRAEGFGLPMAEAMLSGLAVITTGWSGQTDFCTPETAWPIDYSFARAKTHFGLSGSAWAEPDESHLAELMKEVFQATAQVRSARIAAGQHLLRERFLWSHTAQRMVDAARACAKGIMVKDPRIGWVTTWNIRCGIATYSEHLIGNMPSDVTVFASRTDSMSRTDGSNVCRCWSAGDHDDLTELAREIQRHSVDTLVIQFNYGFFNLETFGNFLVLQKKLGHTIVVTMHATNDPVHAPHKKLSLLATALKCCDRVLVHSPHDMNRLKKLGVIENVALFPHGLVDYFPQLNTSPKKEKDFVVASYGFFLPHKGLLELIDSIAILRKQGIQVQLDMVNAEYPAIESQNIIEQARGKIKMLNLGGQVNICTDFLSDEESLARLSKADLIIFPYQTTGESASGAVRYGLASGRPVAVTPLDIFNDVAQAVHVLPGTTPAEIAKGIALLASQLSNADELAQKKEQQAEQWRVEHRYSKVGPRLNQMLIALYNQQNSKF